jgi:hypothetical protein
MRVIMLPDEGNGLLRWQSIDDGDTGQCRSGPSAAPGQAISTRSVRALSQASCRTFRACTRSAGSQKSGQRTQRASQVTAGGDLLSR